MSLNFTRNNFQKLDDPPFVLCKASGERLGIIPCIEKTFDSKFMEVDEATFKTALYIDEQTNPVYDLIANMKYIEIIDVGVFLIDTVTVESEGTRSETKTVTIKSLEYLLGQRYIEDFVINNGTTESIDMVSFYKPSDTSRSLLHLILEKATGWTIGTVPADLYSIERSFEIDRKSIYDFLMDDVSKAFDVFFFFDTTRKRINVYHTDSYGSDCNIHVSYNNLLKNTNMECNTDNIKTCITLTGDNDLTLREINMGYSELYSFDYYASEEFWSSGLLSAYNMWQTKYNSKLPQYTSLLSQYENYIGQIEYQQSSMMPDTDTSSQWIDMSQSQAKGYMRGYSYNLLSEKKAAYEQQLTVMQKSGWGVASHEKYSTKYLPAYNVIQWIDEVLSEKTSTINNIERYMATLMTQMEQIISQVAMQNNFTQAQLEELAMFIREDELSSDNYVVTDEMTESEKYEMLNDMLEYGQRELVRVSTPQLSFDSSIINLFEMPEFDQYSGEFEVGNYIWVTLRDDYHIKAKLLSIHYNFFDPTDFSCTFGNVIRKAKDVFTDITDALNLAKSAATSVSFNSSYWSQSAEKTSTIDEALQEGLTRAGYVLTDGTGTDAVWDERGLFLNTADHMADGSAAPYPNDAIFLGGGRILFTADDWKTVETALGRIDVYEHNDSKGTNTMKSTFGLLAKAITAGDIWGSRIIGGTIKSSNYKYSGSGVYSTTGTLIDLTNSIIRTPNFAISSSGTAYFRGSGEDIDDGTIGSAQLANGSVISDKIASSAVTGNKIANNAITGSKIVDGAVGTDKIVNLAITETKIAGNAISTAKLQANAVVADKIASNAVTAVKIAANAITTEKISAYAITSTKIASSAITSDKIDAYAITANKISSSAITSDKIEANAITAGKIASGAITSDKIQAYAITADKIQSYAISADKIASSAITSDKIQANAITAGKIATDALQSSNYSSSYGIYSRNGTYFNLSDGSIHSKNFAIDSSGNAYFKGDVSGSTISGSTISGSTITAGSITIKDNEIEGNTWSIQNNGFYGNAHCEIKGGWIYGLQGYYSPGLNVGRSGWVYYKDGDNTHWLRFDGGLLVDGDAIY